MSDPADPIPDKRVSTLGPARHACHACGTCCSGWRVRMADDSEKERVLRQASELGVQRPLVGDELRQIDSTCVFLGEDKLCRIHAAYGETEKPLTCQLFPRRSLRAEEGVRFGIDPGCSSTFRSFADGPELSLWFIPTKHDEHIKPGLAAVESKLIRLTRSANMTVARFASALSGEPSPAPQHFPQGFGTRLIDRMRATVATLEDRDNGPMLRADLAPLIAFLKKLGGARRLTTDRLPPLVVPAELDAFVLDVMQRSLFLRIAGTLIPPSGQALMVLGGALTCALTDPTPARFGPALSAYSRVSRFDTLWHALAPDTDTARWIVTGE